MQEISTTFTTDVFKTKETLAFHGTDVFKSKAQFVFHGTDTLMEEFGTKSHKTDIIKIKLPEPLHKTDVYKRSATKIEETQIEESAGEILGVSQADQIGIPKASKNSNTYLNIGSGLSVLVGLPRLPTWNISGRPKKPRTGTMGFNTEIKALEIWDGFSWQATSMETI